MSCSFLSLPSPQSVPIILTCFHLCRDAEMLAQRVKSAKASAGDQPPAGTSRAPLLVLRSPDNSPRHRPQRKFIIHPSST